jgi:flagellar protein FliT
MTTSDILLVYDEMVQISQQMLDAAHRQDWPSFATLEAVCEEHIKQIHQGDAQPPLTSEEVEKKIDLLMKILADDRQIRELLEPWMGRLSAIMRTPRS